MEGAICHKFSGYSFWGGQAWNPTLGRVSLQRGANIFLQYYFYLSLFGVVLYALFLAMLGLIIVVHDNNVISDQDGKNATIADHQLLEQLRDYERMILHGGFILVSVFVAVLLLSAISSRRCKIALDRGVISDAKKYFWVLFAFTITNLILLFVNENLSGLWILWDVVFVSIDVFGMIIVYNRIREMMQVGAQRPLQNDGV